MPVRRSERCIALTDEAVKALPVGKNYMDFHYDTEVDRLVVRHMPAHRPPSFHFLLTVPQYNAAQAMGRDLGRYLTLGNIEEITVEEARTKARAISAELQDLVTKAKVRQQPLPLGKKGVKPEAILAKRKAVENPNYDLLQGVLMDAFMQASQGKGADRHGGLDFEDQDMMAVIDRVGVGFSLGQAIKKASEGSRLTREKARAEFLGAIVYLAGTIVWMDKQG